MPNLKTDRVTGMALGCAALNVRRLMYQPLIWCVDLRDHARGLGSALDAEHVQGAANALVDRVRGNAELDRDLFRRQMLVDQQQAIELAAAELGDALGDPRIAFAGRTIRSATTMAAREFTLHQHERLFTAKEGIKQKGSAMVAMNSVLFRSI